MSNSSRPGDSPESRSSEPRRKQPPPKRRAIPQSDEDDDQGLAMREAGMDELRPKAKRARVSYTSSSAVADEMDVDIDVEGEGEEDYVGKGKGVAKKGGTAKKKRVAIFSSDEEFIDEDARHSPVRQVSSPLPSMSDGEYDQPSRTKPTRQRTMSWKAKEGGAGSTGSAAIKPSKGKAPAKSKAVKRDKDTSVKEIKMRDERKRTNPPPLPKPTLDTQEDTLLDIMDEEPMQISALTPSRPESSPETKKEEGSAGVVHSKEPTPPPVLPKKKKLPTIKKNKLSADGKSNSGASTTTPTQNQPSSGLPKPPGDKEKGKAGPSNRPPVAPSGPSSSKPKPAAPSEFDLRDKSAWNAIFKQGGGSTPRSGLSRREKDDERRKELHKMRDEARAKRDEALKNTFDLQSAWDKISAFEERLRGNRSSAQYPNIFAAKFRDEYEQAKRRRG